MSVAALGHARVDEPALGAADVAVALAAAGSTPGDFAVSLASDDVRDAALALALGIAPGSRPTSPLPWSWCPRSWAA
jgi:N-acetylmuramic acid 6-phosphate (MurNAc-6-P) etherase